MPPDVQHVFKKRNFKKTTRCKDKRNASIQAALMIAEWQQKIDQARGNPGAVINKLANLKALNQKQRELKQFAFIEPADNAHLASKDLIRCLLIFDVAELFLHYWIQV